MQHHKFVTGQLIKWYEYYADGDIVKDAGTGVIVGTKTNFYESSSGNIIEYTNFEVYRNKNNDIITLNENDLESL